MQENDLTPFKKNGICLVKYDAGEYFIIIDKKLPKNYNIKKFFIECYAPIDFNVGSIQNIQILWAHPPKTYEFQREILKNLNLFEIKDNFDREFEIKCRGLK